MNQEERDELLIRIDERVKKIRLDQRTLTEEANSKEGFARCQVHKADTENMNRSLSRLRRSIWGMAIAISSAIGIDYFTR
jgi:hypothetical protein